MNYLCRGAVMTLVVCLTLLSCPIASFSQQGGGVSVIADGSATMEGTTQEAATSEALRDAMRNAVQHALGAMVSSETMVENFVLIKDKILTKVDGYVSHYEIISQKCSAGDCTVKIQANVEEMSLADDVAALANILPMMNYPTVVVAFNQKTLGADLQSVGLDMATVEQTFYEKLGEKGFRIAEASALEAEKMRQAALMGMTGNQTGQALEMASHLAQVMVSGQAVLQDNGANPYNDKIHSYGAFLTGKVYETGTGRVIASGSSESNLPHHSFAIGTQKAAQKAAEQLADELSDKIVQGWLQACYNEHDISLVIEEITFGKMDQVRSAIMKNVQGVLRVNQRNFIRGRGEVEIGWQNCNTQRLAQQINGLKVDDGALEVLEVQGNIVRVKYVVGS